MYKISLFTQKLEENIPIVNVVKNQNIFNVQEAFCDKNQLVDYSTAIFHTYFLIGENKLVISDATVYSIAEVFNSNQFICIDDPDAKTKDLPNVDFYDINSIDPNDINTGLLKILQQEKYDEYKL